MQYQVLARKWRPQNFHELVGQEHVSRTLLNALQSGRVAHAFLFSGPRGSGKTTTARILAKALNCHKAKPGEPCAECPACVEIAAGNCMDVLEIDAASNRGIDEIRELRENVRYRPARDRYKVFIIDEAHMLTQEAFNALLKTLEEPPPHVIFLLATTEYHKIPPTILSRCQQYNFKLIPFPLVLNRLRQIALAENIQMSDSALEQIAFSSGGSLRDAMSALDQVIAFSGNSVRDQDVTMLLGLVEPAVLGDVTRAIARHDSERILKVVSELVESGQDLQNFCRRLLGHVRNLMVLKAGAADASALGIPDSLVPDLLGQAGFFSPEDLLRFFDSLVQTEFDLKHATQIRFQLEMGLIKLVEISRLRSLEDLIADFTALVEGDRKPAAGAQSRAQGTPSPREPEARPKPNIRFDQKNPSSSEPDPGPARAQAAVEAAARETQVAGPRGLMQRIAATVRKESLESILLELSGPELREDMLVLNLTSVNEFYRRQVKENLPIIAEAASTVLGRPIKVDAGQDATASAAAQGMPAEERPSPKAGALERARRDPLVRSFLDTFPGPVKAEELD